MKNWSITLKDTDGTIDTITIKADNILEALKMFTPDGIATITSVIEVE